MKRTMMAVMGAALLGAVGLAQGADWSENFDSYANGSQMIGQGGWDGWYGDPNAGALVTDAQAHSDPHSVESVGASDLVHPNLGATSGRWTLTAWHYIPTGNNDSTYFIANNEYDGGNQTAQWSIEVNFTTDGKVLDDFRSEENDIDVTYDEWVELRIEIDLDADTQQTFYGGTLLSTGQWAIRGGAAELANIDLFSNGPSEFFDDISLTEVGGGEPCGESARLSIKCKKGGKKVKAKLKKADKNADVTFAVDGGDEQQANTGNRGKAKVKWNGLAEGDHEVTVCDLGDTCG